jgi:hypothetical protein
MIMKKTSFLFITTLLIFAISQSCKGPQGDVGPAGVQGIQGLPGIQGIPGKDASKIRYSEWTTLTNWSGSGGKERGKSFPIVGEFKEDGFFLVFALAWLYDGVGVANLLPSDRIENLGIAFDYLIAPKSNINLRAKSFIDFPVSDNTLNRLKFRWVFVPLGNSGGRKASINYSDYEAVKKAYNIPD